MTPRNSHIDLSAIIELAILEVRWKEMKERACQPQRRWEDDIDNLECIEQIMKVNDWIEWKRDVETENMFYDV